jgi:hypothetical protein
MEYYIYHIEGIKIGCSTNPKKRVKEQGYEKYQIIESHSDVNTAANRELELQTQYGYKVDCVRYNQSLINWSKKKINGHSKGFRTIVKSLDNSFEKVYDSLSDACRDLDLDKGNALKVINGVYSQHKGFILKYI